MENNKIKKKVLNKYEKEAIEKDSMDWISKGHSPRVPESRSSHYFIDRKVEEALKYCEYKRGARVLEIGCSFGHMTYLLSQKFDHLTAVDISPKSIEIAKKRLKYYGINNVTFKVDDAEELSTINNSAYDIVFSFSTIRYCPNPRKALKEIYKKLDKNGTTVIDFPNRYSPWHIFIKGLAHIKKHIHDNVYTQKEVIEMFHNAGFKHIELKYFLFTTKRLPDVLLPIFRIIDSILEKIPIIRNFAGIIMVRGVKN